MPDQADRDWIFRIKAATRDLVDRAGGLERAGRITGRGKSTVERWRNGDADVIPLIAALQLERDVGEPMITRAMAEIGGRSLGPDQAKQGASFIAAFAGVARAQAELSAGLAVAIADGVIDPNEQLDLNRLSHESGAANAQLQTVLASAHGEAIHVQRGRR